MKFILGRAVLKLECATFVIRFQEYKKIFVTLCSNEIFFVQFMLVMLHYFIGNYIDMYDKVVIQNVFFYRIWSGQISSFCCWDAQNISLIVLSTADTVYDETCTKFEPERDFLFVICDFKRN